MQWNRNCFRSELINHHCKIRHLFEAHAVDVCCKNFYSKISYYVNKFDIYNDIRIAVDLQFIIFSPHIVHIHITLGNRTLLWHSVGFGVAWFFSVHEETGKLRLLLRNFSRKCIDEQKRHCFFCIKIVHTFLSAAPDKTHINHWHSTPRVLCSKIVFSTQF